MKILSNTKQREIVVLILEISDILDDFSGLAKFKIRRKLVRIAEILTCTEGMLALLSHIDEKDQRENK